jgi:hypothetical protein
VLVWLLGTEGAAAAAAAAGGGAAGQKAGGFKRECWWCWRTRMLVCKCSVYDAQMFMAHGAFTGLGAQI